MDDPAPVQAYLEDQQRERADRGGDMKGDQEPARLPDEVKPGCYRQAAQQDQKHASQDQQVDREVQARPVGGALEETP